MQHNLRAQAFEEATEDVSAGALPKEMKKERCVAGYPLCGVARRNTPWRSSRLWCPGLPSAALAVEKRALEPPKDTAERVHRELQESLDVDATAKCPHCLLVVPPSYLSRHVKLCAEAKPAAGSDSDEDGSGGRDGVAVVPCPSCGMKVQRARMARHVSSGTCARAQASGATRFSWHLCVCVVCVSVSVCLCACVCVCLVVAPAIAPPQTLPFHALPQANKIQGTTTFAKQCKRPRLPLPGRPQRRRSSKQQARRQRQTHPQGVQRALQRKTPLHSTAPA